MTELQRAEETRTSTLDGATSSAGRHCAPSRLPAPLRPGDVLGEYVVEEECGAGGFGGVYRARDGAGQPVALKILHPYLAHRAEGVARFRRELAAVQRIAHPGVVSAREIASADGRWFIAMDWVPGDTLARAIDVRGALPAAEVLAIAAQLCEALEAAHRAGVVHRDLKASNIMVSAAGGVVLVDFGIAKLFEPETGESVSFTASAATLGSPHAMAPEQLRGERVDARTDVYALGVLLFELLTGVRPFCGSPEEVQAQHLDAPPPRPSDIAVVPGAVDAVVIRCLAKRPNDRYASAAAVANALECAVGGRAPVRSADAGLGGTVVIHVGPEDDSAAAWDAADAAIDVVAAWMRRRGLDVVPMSECVLGVVRSKEQLETVRAAAVALAATFDPELVRVSVD